MAPIKCDANSSICKSGDSITQIFVIASGTVTATMSGGSYTLNKGDIIGIIDMFSGEYSFDYSTKTECALIPYPYGNHAQFTKLISAKSDIAHLVFSSMMRQTATLFKIANDNIYKCNTLTNNVSKEYEEYKNQCSKFKLPVKMLQDASILEPLSIEDNVEKWMQPYYESLTLLDKSVKLAFYAQPTILVGLLREAAREAVFAMGIIETSGDHLVDCMNTIINEDSNDALNIYTSFIKKVSITGSDISQFKDNVYRFFDSFEKSGVVSLRLISNRKAEFEEMLKNNLHGGLEDNDEDIDILDNSFLTICNYASIDDTFRDQFKENIDKFYAVSDKSSPEDHVRKLRTAITKDFYTLYSEVFMIAVNDSLLPEAVTLFMNFGFLDERFLAEENLRYLLKLSRVYKAAPSQGVYTMFEWLKAIYLNRKEPSKNEFDLDFPAYLKEQRVSGNISANDEARMLNDSYEKVSFEMHNMFPVANRMATGQVTTFCPILSEHNILKSLKDSLITSEKLGHAINHLREIDFSAYFRDTVFSSPSNGISKEFIRVEVLPDIILTPCVGIRGAMWQEIEGKVRTTHSRMILPTFYQDNVEKIIARLTGEFRWEMCKRVQGARWNDVSERSLTSEYCDYVQFYKKNHDLSTEAKEKIKNNLAKSRNSFKEMFVRDYMEWIFYECEGSPRMNKVARSIIMTYCPFSSELRETYKDHPLYSDGIRYFTSKNNQLKKHLSLLVDKLEKEGFDVPPQIEMQIEMAEL